MRPGADGIPVVSPISGEARAGILAILAEWFAKVDEETAATND